MQSVDTGDHVLERGARIISRSPEVIDAVMDTNIPVFAAGRIANRRGVAAALGLGALGAVMGAIFLAVTEAKISKGYQQDVLRISDGGQTAVRMKLYDQMGGKIDWPSLYDGRNIINKTIIGPNLGMNVETIRSFTEKR